MDAAASRKCTHLLEFLFLFSFFLSLSLSLSLNDIIYLAPVMSGSLLKGNDSELLDKTGGRKS